MPKTHNHKNTSVCVHVCKVRSPEPLLAPPGVLLAPLGALLAPHGSLWAPPGPLMAPSGPLLSPPGSLMAPPGQLLCAPDIKLIDFHAPGINIRPSTSICLPAAGINLHRINNNNSNTSSNSNNNDNNNNHSSPHHPCTHFFKYPDSSDSSYLRACLLPSSKRMSAAEA